MHYHLSVFAKLILPPSPASKETLIWRFWPLQELPKCIWHSVEHLVCTVLFGKLSGLHYGLEPLTDPPCPLSALLPLPPSCAVPAPPSSSRARWHFVEQVPCVPWARPECTFCTRAHYADTQHCRTRRDPTLAPSASLNRALAAPCSTVSLTPCCAAGRALGGTPASAADSAADGAAQTASARQLPQSTGRAYPPARRHAFVAATMPCNYSNGCRRRSYLLPPRSTLERLYKGNPEPLRALRRHQTSPIELPAQ